MQENTAQGKGKEKVRRRADRGGKPVRANAEAFRLMKKTGGRADGGRLEGTGPRDGGQINQRSSAAVQRIVRAAGHRMPLCI